MTQQTLLQRCTHLDEKNLWEIEQFRLRCPHKELLPTYIKEHGAEIGRAYCKHICEYKCRRER